MHSFYCNFEADTSTSFFSIALKKKQNRDNQCQETEKERMEIDICSHAIRGSRIDMRSQLRWLKGLVLQPALLENQCVSQAELVIDAGVTESPNPYVLKWSITREHHIRFLD